MSTKTVSNMGWRDRAACRGIEPATFFPIDDEGIARAKELCAACPVRTDCLEFALAAREWEGIWGGLTEVERRRLHRQRRRSA